MNTPTMASAKAMGGQDAWPALANPPSSSGFMSMGKSGSVAAATIIPRIASANLPA